MSTWCPHGVTSILSIHINTICCWNMTGHDDESCFLQGSTVGSYSGWFPCSSWSACRTAVEEMSGSSGPTIKYPVSQRSFRMFQDLFHNNKHCTICTFLTSLHSLHCAGKSPLLNLQHLISLSCVQGYAMSSGTINHLEYSKSQPSSWVKISQLWPASWWTILNKSYKSKFD